jgi:hypothetical protein
MDAPSPDIRAGVLMGRALRDLVRPPFLTLVALSLFVYVVSLSAAESSDDATLLFTLLLAVVSAYAQIACILAAATSDPVPSGDAWLVDAVRRRCFLRFLLAETAALILIVVGFLGLVVGGFIVGGFVALAQPAAVLERRWPIDALKRSAALGRPVRKELVVVFGTLMLAPAAGLQLANELGVQDALGMRFLALGLPGVALMLAGTIAVARAFTSLGGAPASPPSGGAAATLGPRG